MSGLSPRHLEQLRASGLDDETIHLNQLSTSDSADDIRAKLNWQAQPSGRWTLGSCLVLPMIEPGSVTPYAHRVRPDNPRRDKNGKARKYESPVGAGVLVFFAARARQHGWYGDASKPLVWTEGEKKAMLLDQLGHACVGLTGVWNAHDPEARTRGDGFVLHPLIQKHVAVASRSHVICFDNDAHAKPEVMQAARVLAGMLFAAGATRVCFVTPPEGHAKGVDDYFVACGSGEAASKAVRALLEAAQELDPAAAQPSSRPRVRSFRFYKNAPVPERLRVPPGYELRDDGSLWKGNDDDAEFVAQRAVLVSGAARDEDGVYRIGVVFKRRDDWCTRFLERSVLNSGQRAGDFLLACGAQVNAGNSRAVAIWLTDLEAENELELAEQTYVKSGGWRDEGRVFVLADRALTLEGTTDRYHVDPEDPQLRALRATTCAGDEGASKEAWRTAFAASPEMAAVLMGSLAAPLLQHTGARPFGIHLFGESSGGKTTVLSLAASAWGNGALDDQASFIGTWSSTTVAVEQRAATLSDLPTCLDEAHLMPADDRARVVYQILSGQGKARGQKQGGLRRQLTWRTVLLSTGETVLVADNAAVGANVRVIQLQFARPELTSSDVACLQRAAREHHGQIGPAFVRALMASSPQELRAAYGHALEVAYRRAGTSALDKRQAEAVAVLMLAEGLCAELFHIGDPEGSTMLGLLSQDSTRKEVESEASRGIEALTEWIAVRSSSFPHLATDRQGRKGYTVDGQREVLGYIDEPAGLMHFLKGPCTEQLRRTSIDANVLMRGLRAQGALVTESADQLTNRACVNGERPRVYSVRLAALRQESPPHLSCPGRLALVQPTQGGLTL